MSDRDLDGIIVSLFEMAFDAQPEEVTDGTRRGELERWDSLGHLELLELLRERFKIDISPELALDMETVADIKRIVKQLSTEQHPGSGEGVGRE